ncbi:tRNA lysidine(34) synthetase TilS [Sphingomonas glaciei]|uniref:tRNA(Ile)-lysidine synthase n=1 Tax=Sphingomonas glaciei TaxID=2938948 RepID=A0ABY5MTA4_9SPHN|nr:tRNA lysidine(34) synthetase TilS [Sphingomonas glaciei]UUR07647.1 tRNA lysidine(34) synthetase TilS [Sphingomonas glaciei]
MTAAVPADAGTRLAAALDRLVPDGQLGIAVSGGPDSLALLLLAASARPGRVRAATVDHRLRPENADEATMVADLCAKLGVPHDILSLTVGQGASLQARAREARYAALGEWAASHGLASVATAHHADDQAETLLMRLARGSGLGGLSGIRERAEIGGCRVVRPLLQTRKAELVEIVTDAGWTPVSDPANSDPRHERTRVRKLLAAVEWLDPQRLARSAAALAEASEALDAAVEQARQRHLAPSADGMVLRDIPLLPREIRRRLLLAALAAFETRPSGPELDRLLAALDEGRRATVGLAKVTPEAGGVWRIELAPPRRQLHT